MKLAAKTTDELQKIHQEALEQYEDFKSLHLQLNMARGKPCAEQLDLALGVLEALHARSEFANSNGDDCRNYGVWNGLPEMRAIFSEMMDVPADQIISVSYTHLRAHETEADLVCRLLLEKIFF